MIALEFVKVMYKTLLLFFRDMVYYVYVFETALTTGQCTSCKMTSKQSLIKFKI